jgi:hypothetical protein
MHWRIRRIVNGCAAQQLVARQDVIAPEFISYGLVIRAINRKPVSGRSNNSFKPTPRRGLIQALRISPQTRLSRTMCL